MQSEECYGDQWVTADLDDQWVTAYQLGWDDQWVTADLDDQWVTADLDDQWVTADLVANHLACHMHVTCKVDVQQNYTRRSDSLVPKLLPGFNSAAKKAKAVEKPGNEAGLILSVQLQLLSKEITTCS